MSATELPTPFDLSVLTRIASADRLCLFLDVDGTLLEIAPTPHSVRVDDPLRDLLLRVSAALDGAVALISGRSLAALDSLFALGSWPAAGLHGGERRDAAGRVRVLAADGGRLEPVRSALRRLVAETPGALLEDKTHGLAVHYRAVPEFEWQLRRIVRQCAVPLSPEYHVLDGKCVIEIKPAVACKARAIRAFLDEPPFAGRMPIFVGDDVTDLDGFACVEEAGGVSVAVGAELPAQLHLASPREVRALLSQIAARARRAR
jgi:trehalose 6-phosphate phosphatase